MKLSICVTFCDKDQNFIDDLVKQIHEHVKIDHEIIICDNRKSRDDLVIKTKPTFRCYDEMCFIPRKRCLDYITGDYVWYIDADDVLLNTVDESIFKNNSDIIVNRFDVKDGEIKWIGPIRRDKTDNTIIKCKFNLNNMHKLGTVLWNKFYKTEIFKNIKNVNNVRFFINEDVFVNTYLLKFARTIEFTDKIFYQYNPRIGSYGNMNMSIEKFRNICKDSSKIFDEIPKLFSKEEQKILNKWFSIEYTCAVFFDMIKASSPKLFSKEIEILKEEFSEEVIVNTIKKYFKRVW